MKSCAKCEKTVYPTEELKCLDKVWHKGCFRCWECNMMLSMKNYKGYDKLPYCTAHCPKPKHTQVADTPENKRLGENTKLQSQLQYHSEFEQAKGQYTAVADDPETLRNLQNQKVVSQVKYHEEFERAKGLKTSVVDDPETLRVRKIQDQVSQINYQDHMSKATMMERQRALIDSGDNMPQNMGGRDLHQPEFVQPAAPEPPPPQEVSKPSPYSGRTQGHTTVYNAGSKGGKVEPASNRRVGSIADYDPMNENYGSITQQQHHGRPQQQQQYHQQQQRQQQQHHHQQQQQQQQHYQQQQQHHQPQQPSYQSYNQRPPQQQSQAPPSQPQYHQPVRKEPEPPRAAPPQGPRYRAMYDYQAADDDEVSFLDGDVIINVQQIDEGWMTGTVERSRQSGMLPANYVERIS